MRKKYIFGWCAVIGMTASFCFSQELTTGGKETVLMGRMNVLPSVEEVAKKQGKELELKRITEALDSQFITAVSATRVFQIVERKRKGDLELEQAFAAVAVNPNDKNAAKLGEMAGAKYAFLAQIDGFEDRMESVDFKLSGTKVAQRKAYLSALVQVIDTTTGKPLPDAPSERVTKTVAGPDAASDRFLMEIATEMANKLSQKVIAILRPAKVLTVTGKQVLVNRGSEAGFVVGAVVGFYAVQEIKDPDTGEIFRNELPVGEGKIARTDTQKSFAMIDGDNLGVAPGCVVKITSSPSAPAQEAAPTAKNLEKLW